MKKRIMVLMICIIFTFLFSSCNIYAENDRYEIIVKEDNSAEMITPDGKKYTTLKDNYWYPEIIYDNGEKDVIGKSNKGYVFNTTSDKCLYVDELNGRFPYCFFQVGVQLSKMSKENVNKISVSFKNKENIFIEDKEYINAFIDFYYENENVSIKKATDLTNEGKIILYNALHEGLFFSITLYSDGQNLYFYRREDENIIAFDKSKVFYNIVANENI
ncbi:MAG: hypothetical protein RR954_06045 [Christensenellaceae bacterium]